jgi:hypothetical protein
MSFLYIEGDPSLWDFSGPEAGDLSWMQSADPVTLTVDGPVFGTMILMPRRVGSLAVVTPPPSGGWVPCVTLEVPHLYVSSPQGPTTAAPGYTLGASTDLQALQRQITAAMQAGSSFTLDVSLPPRGLGTAVLNGATLAFVVICPPHKGTP